MTDRPFNFRVDASLMRHLGETLITDDLQALIELIKNAYDADATRVRLTIDGNQQITVSDDGHGMDAPTIERGWLTISNSIKMEQKRKGQLTETYKRTPLGDKGLGRFSAQRLGRKLRIDTVPRGGDRRYSVVIDWTQFQPGTDLVSVPISVESSPRGDTGVGTIVTVSGLASPDYWLGLNPGTLRKALAVVVSPYAEVASFRLVAFLNGEEVSPYLIAPNVRRAATHHLVLSYSDQVLTVTGKVKGQTFRGMTTSSKEAYDRLFLPDQGRQFAKYLLGRKKSTDYGLSLSQDEGYFVDCGWQRVFRDIAGSARVNDPGPFRGEVDSFAMDPRGAKDIMGNVDVFASVTEAKEFVQALSGIRVYRDGFVVRTAHDWLELGRAQTTGGSFYGLRPFNTMGFISISASGNGSLRETTNREGFVVDEAYAGFYAILQAFVNKANLLMEHLRRTWGTYVKEQISMAQDLPSRDPAVVASRIETSFAQVEDAKGLVDKAVRQLGATIADDAASLFPSGTAQTGNLAEVQELLSEAAGSLQTVANRKGLSALLVAELDSLNDRLGEVYELVGLGITAEVLSHEISNVLDRLRGETHSVQKHSKESGLDDIKVLRYFEVVRTAVSALEKQIAHLDPALRFSREKRETFKLSFLLSETAEYYENRYKDQSIRFAVDIKHDFVVSMNKGKLIQVFDNLILNSEYWLKALKSKAETDGLIRVSVERPAVVIEDNGQGVEVAFEETLFDPFVTAKPKGQGRGLGLFIATQLLETDGCSLVLLPDRNTAGRRYRFSVGLEGVIVRG